MYLPPARESGSLECGVCCKTFSTKYNRQRHQRNTHRNTHRSDKSCPLIRNLSSSMGQSAKHTKVYSEEKIWVCSYPACKRGKKVFTRHDNLIQHYRLVHEAHIPKRKR